MVFGYVRREILIWGRSWFCLYGQHKARNVWQYWVAIFKGRYSCWSRNSRKTKWIRQLWNLAWERNEAPLAEVFSVWDKPEVWFSELVFQLLSAHRAWLGWASDLPRAEDGSEWTHQTTSCSDVKRASDHGRFRKRVSFAFQGTIMSQKLFFPPSSSSPFPRHCSHQVRSGGRFQSWWSWCKTQIPARCKCFGLAGTAGGTSRTGPVPCRCLTCISSIIPAWLLRRDPSPAPSCSPC